MPKNLLVLLLLGASLACAQTITIQNPGFETATLPLNTGTGPFNNVLPGSAVAVGGTLDGWTASGTTANANGGAWHPALSAPWWNGSNIGYLYVSSPGTVMLSQTLSAALQNATTYSLSATVSSAPNYINFTLNYSLQLWAGSTLLASSSRFNGQVNFTGIDTVTSYSGSNHPQAGQPLRIVIVCTGPSTGFSGVLFDDLSLTGSTSPTVGAAISTGAYGAFSSASPGSWVDIYGGNLAGNTRSWAGTDFNGITAPTSLDGTNVTVGGKAAFIDYISPGQVNILLSSDTPTGAQQLIVTSPAGTTTAYSITINPTQPGLLAPPTFKIGTVQYAVGIFVDGTYALPTGALAGVTSRPAKPGDIVTLYGVGFGPVTPAIPAGQLVQQLNALAMPLLMSIGGIPVTLSYEGLAPGFTGLYQLNITGPAVAAGDAALTFTLGGTAGTQALYLPVGN